MFAVVPQKLERFVGSYYNRGKNNNHVHLSNNKSSLFWNQTAEPSDPAAFSELLRSVALFLDFNKQKQKHELLAVERVTSDLFKVFVFSVL